MSEHVPTLPPSRTAVALAFAAIYVVWGSTYLAILFAIDTLPPFLMAGSRFLVAGGILAVATLLRGAPRPTRIHWRSSIIVGGLMLLGGNGGVVWAERTVPSGIAALLVATVPLFMAALDSLMTGGALPRGRKALGLLIGFGGVALLVGPSALAGEGDGRVDPLGCALLVLASLSWAIGSLYARRAPLPTSAGLATGMEMIGGGALLLVVGLLRGEVGELDASAVSSRSLLALGYLITFGSLIGFSAYSWLLRVSTPARVATYAYVNPVVAVLLGWAFASEPIGARTLMAAAVIIFGVVLITTARATPERSA